MEEVVFSVIAGVVVGFLATSYIKINSDKEQACRLSHTELGAYEKCVSTTEYEQTVRVLKSELEGHSNGLERTSR